MKNLCCKFVNFKRWLIFSPFYTGIGVVFRKKMGKSFDSSRKVLNFGTNIYPWRGFDREPLKLHKQMIPHILALDVVVKICQEQLCSSIRDDQATFLVKNTLFKGEVAWQPLKELQSCSSSILVPPTRAFKWGIVCLSTTITFEDTSSYVKKCPFLLYKIIISWHNYLYLQKLRQ